MRKGHRQDLYQSDDEVPGTRTGFCLLCNSVLYLACFYVSGAELPTWRGGPSLCRISRVQP
jgi:hypothetical protein